MRSVNKVAQAQARRILARKEWRYTALKRPYSFPILIVLSGLSWGSACKVNRQGNTGEETLCIEGAAGLGQEFDGSHVRCANCGISGGQAQPGSRSGLLV